MVASTSNHDEQVHQVRWTYPREHLDDGDNWKLVLSGKETIISEIKKRILEEHDRETLDLMEKSVFKDLMRYPNVIKKSARCIHYVVTKEAIKKPDPYPMVIYYKVKQAMVRFGPMEFALVTGLRFGKARFDPYADHPIPEDSVYTRIFNNNPISPNQLWTWYREKNNFDRVSADDCLKISKVLIVAHIVLGLDASSTKVPDWVWALIEQPKEWDRFPWGSISFQILLKSLKGVKHNIPSKSYHLTGNTLAFMGWIYEAFPDLGRAFGGRLPKNYRPRGLRFTYDKKLNYAEIDVTEVHERLEADHKEINRKYVKSVEPEGTPLALAYNANLLVRTRAVAGMASQPLLPRLPAPPRSAQVPEGTSAAAEHDEAADRDEAVYTLTRKRKRALDQEISKKARMEIEGSDILAQKVADIVVKRMTALLFPERVERAPVQEDENTNQVQEDEVGTNEVQEDEGDTAAENEEDASGQDAAGEAMKMK